MSEHKLEYWWVVKCKTPGCVYGILLSKIGPVEKYHFPLGALPPDTKCNNWNDTCEVCKITHEYRKEDVFSDKVNIDSVGLGRGSYNFQQACED